jgi:hypothetical protein
MRTCSTALIFYDGHERLERIHQALRPIRFPLKTQNLIPRKIPHCQEGKGSFSGIFGLTGRVCDVFGAVKRRQLPRPAALARCARQPLKQAHCYSA